MTSPADRLSVIRLRTSQEVAVHQKSLPTDGYYRNANVVGFVVRRWMATGNEVHPLSDVEGQRTSLRPCVVVSYCLACDDPELGGTATAVLQAQGDSRSKSIRPYEGKIAANTSEIAIREGRLAKLSSSSTQNNKGSPVWPGLRSQWSVSLRSKVLACAEETKSPSAPLWRLTCAIPDRS